MSKFTAVVEDIMSVDNLNIVSFICEDIKLTMMSLDIDKQIIKGQKVLLGCKPTSIALAKDFSGSISFSNKLECSIEDINLGELLVMVKLKFKEYELESLITKNTFLKMELKKGDGIVAFIKASELAILEIIDE
jgi:molybdopterin-binding protein